MHGKSIIARFALIIAASLLGCVAICTADEFHRLSSTHVELVTDLEVTPEISQLPKQFDEAMVQALDYFGVDRKRAKGWKLTGYLISQPDRFRAAGYLHDKVPPFENGYQLGDDFWFFEQPSAYYRRHLMIHEGIHALMQRFLGGAGPPWYREGMAELLATHELLPSGMIKINRVPRDKHDVPDWGRITKIRETVESGKRRSLPQIMSIPYRTFNTVETYSWGWAACLFLDRHPDFQTAFRRCPARVQLPNQEFNAELLRDLAATPADVTADWRLLIEEIDYGYDVAENRLEEIQPLARLGQTFQVQTDRGWQSSGIAVEKGDQYRVRAIGRYLLDKNDPRWVSEANGVTIEYRQGRPRGQLLLAVHSNSQDNAFQSGGAESEAADRQAKYSLWKPLAVGRSARWTAPRDGIVYLRVNEPAGERSDNEGFLKVLVEPQ